MIIAPVILFVYKRPDLTKRTINSLLQNYLSDKANLFIYSDGPKTEEDRRKVDEVRDYLSSVKGFNSIKIYENSVNKGLAASVIGGITDELRKSDRVIILEDDMVTAPFFLQYMNEALMKYEDEDRVISIHGYTYPVKSNLPETFLIKGADCWGWATWKRGWDLFVSDSEELLKQLQEKNLEYEFDFSGTRNNIRMLKNQISGKVDSWAIRWYASAFLQDKLTLYPGRSLVRNIGLEMDATHSRNAKQYDTVLSEKPIKLEDIHLTENVEVRKIFEDYFKSIDPNFINRVIKKIKYRLK